MKMQEIDNTEASNKLWAYLDARMRNSVNASLYSDRKRLQAERLKLRLEFCYAAKGIHINYRKRFITLKVDQPVVRDRKELRLLEQELEKQNVVKKISAQGICYNILP
jgi:hypothetical protein